MKIDSQAKIIAIYSHFSDTDWHSSATVLYSLHLTIYCILYKVVLGRSGIGSEVVVYMMDTLWDDKVLGRNADNPPVWLSNRDSRILHSCLPPENTFKKLKIQTIVEDFLCIFVFYRKIFTECDFYRIPICNKTSNKSIFCLLPISTVLTIFQSENFSADLINFF